MNWPLVSRKRFDAKVKELEDKIEDIAKHFVTKRDEQGRVIETLADRHRRGATPPKRVKMNQLCKWLEQTDGGRKVGEQQRPS